ncbi:hypothetical protein [Rhodanobacter caeni]|uniref:Uncharacterized protein n=1 Tax=Rhodanobacter caeni TaxID=657654 RepID=A0ABN0USY4_9GAMM
MSDLFRKAAMRLRDWRHERYIRRLKCSVQAALRKPDRIMAHLYWQAMVSAINARSPAQVARMEQRMGLAARRSIKRRVMDAFLRGRIPSTFVTAVFKLLRLRSL